MAGPRSTELFADALSRTATVADFTPVTASISAAERPSSHNSAGRIRWIHTGDRAVERDAPRIHVTGDGRSSSDVFLDWRRGRASARSATL